MTTTANTADGQIEIVMNGPEWLVLAINDISTDPGSIVPWFLEPEKLKQWWGDEHRIDARFGGEYVIAWPRIDRTLRGQIVEIGETNLIYSWTFDHEPDIPPRVVAIQAITAEGGTRIEIRHGPYRRDDSDAEERTGHLEGWSYFLPLLAKAIAEST